MRIGSYGGGYEYRSGGGGGGGGHGGYGNHQMYLKAGETAAFSRTAEGISGTVGETTISVSHGKNGGASGSSRGNGGAGGSASGANTLNLNGGAGNAGEFGKSHRIPSGDNSSQTRRDIAGGNGGEAGTISAQKYSSGKAGVYQAAAPEFDLGNAGAGGKGGVLRLEDGGGTSYLNGNAGSAGCTGGVVIETGSAG